MKSLQRTSIFVRSLLPGPVPVDMDSSAIRHAEYERGRKILRVSFQRGATYEFGSVEPRLFRELAGSKSAGRFFVEQIRNSYPYRRIDG